MSTRTYIPTCTGRKVRMRLHIGELAMTLSMTGIYQDGLKVVESIKQSGPKITYKPRIDLDIT